jgi:trimeric autotransporter adhesin
VRTGLESDGTPMPIPIFTQVVYLSPWFPLPPGWSKVGVDAFVSLPSGTGQVLAGRLRQGDTVLLVGVGVSATEVVLVPTSPLSTALAYFLDVQWVPQGTQPGSIVWTTPGTIATSPIVSSVVTLTGGSITGSAVSVGWDFGAAALTPAGANLSAFNTAGQSAGFNRVQGLTGTLNLNNPATPGTQMYLQGVMPVSGTPGTGFAAPFSMGPIVSGAPLPLSAPTITQIQYDSGTVRVAWTAPTPPTTGGAVRYDLIVSSGSAVSTVFEASAGGGLAVLGATPPGVGWSVAGRVRIGPVTGASGTEIALLTQTPVIDQIAVQAGGTGVTARITFSGGTSAAVELLKDGVKVGSGSVASSGGTVTIPASNLSGAGWQLRGQILTTASGLSVAGPFSIPLAVLANAPVIADVAVSSNPAGGGWIVTVTAAERPSVGAALVFALSQGGTPIASQTVTDAASATFTLSSNQINGAKVAVASMTTTTAAAASPSSQASFIGVTPTPRAVQNIGASDPAGQPQGLRVDVAAGGQAGQVLAIRLLAGGQVVMTSAGVSSTHANLPLSLPLDPSVDWRIQGRWSGGEVTDSTFGGWSAPVAVLTSTTAVVSAGYDNGQLAIAIQTPQGIQPAQGAYFYAYNTIGGAITGAVRVGTLGTFPFSATSDPWLAAAKPLQPLSADWSNRTVAPSSGRVPLLLTAPSITRIAYDGAVLSANWTIVNDADHNPATSAIMEVTDGAGGVVTAPAGAKWGQVAVQLAPDNPPGAKLRVRATRLSPVVELSGAYCTALVLDNALTTKPRLRNVTIDTGNPQTPLVKAAVMPIPLCRSDTVFRAWLMAGTQTVAGPVDSVKDGQGGVTVSFPYAATGVAGLSIVAQAQALSTDKGPVLEGPRGDAVPVLAVAPSFVTALISPASSTEWKLDASWLPPVDGAAIVSYTLSLIKVADPSVVAKATFGVVSEGTLTFAMSTIDATLPYSLTLAATSANGSVTPLARAAVWFAAAAFTAVTTGSGQVNAQWTAPAGPTGVTYQLSLLDTTAKAVLATTVTTATNGGLDVSALGLSPGGSCALALGIQIGPVLFEAASDQTYKTRPALLLNQPTGLTVKTNAASGKAMLTWTAVPGASGYTVAFSDGSVPAQVTKASYDFPSDLPTGADLRVSIRTNIASSGVVSTGPASASLAVPTLAPAMTGADYDGVNVSGAWAPLAGAASYVATVLNAAGAAVGSGPQIPGTAVAFSLALTAADGPFRIVVQAVTEAGSGPPSEALPLFQPAWFISTEQPSVQPPHTYPVASMGGGATQISIYLPPLLDTGTDPIAISPVIGAFDLQANSDPGTKAAFPNVLCFAAASNVWTFSASEPIRSQIQTDYVRFLEAAETNGASPWGISVLQQAISRWMPQTFAESHYYAYGLSLAGGPGTGSIDLRQGLVLRVGFANYTNVWSGDANSWLNGFGGGSPNDFDVADGVSGNGAWQLSMDSFVAMLTASGAMTVSPPDKNPTTGASAGVADAADLLFPSFPNPFYRLFFPGQLENPTDTGSTSAVANFALASAASFTDLISLATTLPLVYFRGRAVLRLMIRVRVNGAEVVVPLGTTVGNVLDRYGVRPPATGVQLTGVALERASGPGLAVLGPSSPPPSLNYDSATRRRVRLDWSTMATYGGPVDATNLPLLHGDRLEF